MIIFKRDDVLALISRGEQKFRIPIEPDIITKVQLLLTGKAIDGVELFGIGPQEIRGLGFMVEFHELINNAVHNKYRVFVYKDGSYFGGGNWYLEFRKIS